MRSKSVNTKNLLKFILGSAFGLLMFLVPIPQGESFTTLLDFIKGFLKNLLITRRLNASEKSSHRFFLYKQGLYLFLYLPFHIG